MRRQDRRREEALRDWATLLQGFHPGANGAEQAALTWFERDAEWQKASDLIIHALQNSLHLRRGAALIAAPPGWLPPAV